MNFTRSFRPWRDSDERLSIRAVSAVSDTAIPAGTVAVVVVVSHKALTYARHKTLTRTHRGLIGRCREPREETRYRYRDNI